MKTFYKSKKQELKYSHAYDEFKNYISIEGALTLSKRKWFLDIGLNVELTPVFDGEIQQPHWRIKGEQYINIGGVLHRYSSDKDSESIEHKRFKGTIIENGFFEVDEIIVHIKDQREEWKIFDSRFKADILATLHCGTPCVIEVIKTSDLSKKKAEFLNDNEILTFKIYIDENGCQIFKRHYCFGAKKLDEIIGEIRRIEGEIVEIRERKERILSESTAKGSRIDDQVSDLERKIRDIEQRIDEQEAATRKLIESGPAESERRNKNNEREIGFIEDQIKEITGSIREIEQLTFNEDQTDQKYAEQIPELEGDIASMEDKIREIIDRCDPKWFGPEWLKVKNVDKYNQIMWFIS